jgi:uncharacterized protein
VGSKTYKGLIVSLLLLSYLCVGCDKMIIPPREFKTELQIGTSFLDVAVAGSETQKEIGLSGLATLGYNEGMIFPYDSPVVPEYYMKGMQFDLDLIWIYNNRVIAITKNVKAKYQSTLYSPPSAVTAVLEVKAGWTSENNINIGNYIKL